MRNLFLALMSLAAGGTAYTLSNVLEIDTVLGAAALGLPVGVVFGLIAAAVTR